MPLSHVEFLVEEPSAEAAISALVPKILGQGFSFNVYAYQGKHDLLRKLPSRLRGFRSWLPETAGIVVLIDADEQDCEEQKTALENAARLAGFLTRRSADGRRFQVLNRLAVEELEAWFFGDIDALREAYPGIPASLGERASYRHPDAIRGGTWEALERELQRVGHHREGLAKIRAAREVSVCMEPLRNRSPSFRAFREGLLALVSA
jgi:hypothetical protein